jgi:hypothetical protein
LIQVKHGDFAYVILHSPKLLASELSIFRERKHMKSPDGEKSDSSESFRTSDNEDRKKDKRFPSSDEKNADYEAQVGLNYAVYLVNIITYKRICLHIP